MVFLKSKFKYIKRKILSPLLRKRCKCSGVIKAYSQVWGSFGLNRGNFIRILLTHVNVTKIPIDHLWVECPKLNNSSKFKNKKVSFNAMVSSYQKLNGNIGIGLVDLQNIQII